MNDQTKPAAQPAAQQAGVPAWGIGAIAFAGAAVWGFFWLLREQERRDRVHLAKMGRYL